MLKTRCTSCGWRLLCAHCATIARIKALLQVEPFPVSCLPSERPMLCPSLTPPNEAHCEKRKEALKQVHGKKIYLGDCIFPPVKHWRGANLAGPTPSSLLIIFLLDKLVGILVRGAGSKLALLRRSLASPGIGLGRLGSLLLLVILAILSGAGVAVGGSCTIMDLAFGLRDDLAAFVLESVRVDDAADLPGAVCCGSCQSVNQSTALEP